MPGLFDDLVPQAQAKTAGLFDDLVPRAQAGPPAITSQPVSRIGDATDVRGTDVAKSWQLMNTPTQELLGGPKAEPPKDEVARVAKEGTPLEKRAMGVRTAADQFLGSLTSPLGVSTIGIAPALKNLPLVSKMITAAFLAPMAKNLAVDAPKELGTEMGKPKEQRDETKISNIIASEAFGLPLAGHLGADMVSPGGSPPTVAEGAAKMEKPARQPSKGTTSEAPVQPPPVTTAVTPKPEPIRQPAQGGPKPEGVAEASPGRVEQPLVEKSVKAHENPTTKKKMVAAEALDAAMAKAGATDKADFHQKLITGQIQDPDAFGHVKVLLGKSAKDLPNVGEQSVAQAVPPQSEQSAVSPAPVEQGVGKEASQMGTLGSQKAGSIPLTEGEAREYRSLERAMADAKRTGDGERYDRLKDRYDALGAKVSAKQSSSNAGEQVVKVSDTQPETSQKFRLKSQGPQTFTKVRDLPPQKGDLTDEKFVEVKNDRTGKVETVSVNDLKPVNGQPKAEAKPKTDLDAELKQRGYDASGMTKAQKAETLKRDKAIKGPGMVGMGGAMEDEFAPAQPALQDLADATKELPEKPSQQQAYQSGQSTSKIKDGITDSIEGLKAAGSYLKTKLEGRPVWNSLKEAVGDRHLALSESAINMRRWVKDATKRVPDALKQEAISNWVEAGGDPAQLDKASKETAPRYRAGYEAAKKLSPEEVKYAKAIRSYFDRRLQEAIDAGILEDGVENYIHRMYEAESPFKQKILAELRSGINTGKPSLAKQRVFEYDYEAEKAGLKPVKSFIKRIAAYDLALNKAMADRAAVKAMMQIKMPDGRPMIDAGGMGKRIEGDAGDTEATLIRPSYKPNDTENPSKNRGDYVARDYPALRKWKWATNDESGKPILVQGDVLVHPDAMKDVKALFERSAIRSNPVGRAALRASGVIKQTMLDLSGFHPVQIMVHGWEHKQFKPVKEIDFSDPYVTGLVRGGLVVGETTGREMFSEGLAGSSLTKFIPKVGNKLQAYQEWLFNDYIPRLKVATGLHAFERNRAKYKDLSSEELFHLTANEMNAAFGELNYSMLGRSETMRDALRVTLFAPDFLEARGRFAAQAGTKYGAEQRGALVRGAAALYITARIINKILDDQYHFEGKNAFNVVHNGKAYSLRTVQGDLIHLATEPANFMFTRVNPTTVKPAMEFLMGRDQFGRKRSGMQQLKDAAKTPVPISIRGLVGEKEQSLMESLLNGFGVTEHRDSPSADIYQAAQKWKEQHGVRSAPGEFIYDADKDPFRKIRNAAAYYGVDSTRSEIQAAIKSGTLTAAEIKKHFASMNSHPFTGSKAHEQEFYNSLSDDKKKQYQDAKTEKRKVLNVVNQAMP